MSPQNLRARLKAIPFKPLELQTDHGEKYLIKHPETLFVTKTTLFYAEPDSPIQGRSWVSILCL